MGCGCGTVATLTAVTTTQRCPGDDELCSFSTSGSTCHSAQVCETIRILSFCFFSSSMVYGQNVRRHG